jgi:phage terminase large subunit
MIEDNAGIFSALARSLAGEQARSREALVPPAFQFLWQIARSITAWGGRSAAKSWSIARVLLILAYETPLRVLCCREIQGSIKESAYRLLADQIVALQLDDFFEVQSDCILGHNGSRFFFEGLRYNASKIRSYEACDVCWVEEAQSVSDMSWETLLPTIRKPGSRFYISFNPMTKSDPVLRRFVDNPRPDSIVKKVSWRDNPFLSPESDAERQWLEKTDPDAARHVWEGFPREASDALILRGKYSVEPFEVNPAWSGPYHGLDYGFSRDPSAAVRCYINDDTRELYISHEFWRLCCEIDALPAALEVAIPGISRHVVYADSSRPESTSYLQRNGIPNVRGAEKWSGSVDDGIAYLRSFSRIVVHTSCKHTLDEAGSYSFETDRLTGVPLPKPQDSNNHLIDATRYALSPLIRNLPAASFFSRSALLIDGEPLLPSPQWGRPTNIFSTIALCDRPGTAAGIIYWAHWPYATGASLCAIDFDLVEFEEAIEIPWLSSVYNRAQELRREWNAANPNTRFVLEEGDLHKVMDEVIGANLDSNATCLRLAYGVVAVRTKDLMDADWEERAAALRTAVNCGNLAKLGGAAYTRKVTHRSATANHLLSQLLGYRPGEKDRAQELVNAFMLGCLAVRVPPR